jgi:hypothetical protein
MKTLNSLFPVERLTSVGLTRDGDDAVGVEVLYDGGVVSEASLLFPREDGGIREIEGKGYLRLNLIYVLPARASRASE